MQELGSKAPVLQPVRRRIVLLIGAWTPQLPKGGRGIVYQILTDLLSDDDLAVRLAAVTSLRSVVEDWEFDADALSPYRERIVVTLGVMVKQSEEFDTHLQVMYFVCPVQTLLMSDWMPGFSYVRLVCLAILKSDSYVWLFSRPTLMSGFSHVRLVCLAFLLSDWYVWFFLC